MKQKVIIHEGRAGMENPKYPFPKELTEKFEPLPEVYSYYQKTLQLALDNLIYFEDQDKIKKLLPNDEWGRNAYDPKYNPDKIMIVDLPEVNNKEL